MHFLYIAANMEKIDRKIGVCFSGGAALGLAHIGVVKAFEELGIEPQIISGASMGAIVGALYADGYGYAEMIEVVKKHKIHNLFYFIKPLMSWNKAFTSHEKIEKVLRELIPHDSFEGLKRNFHLSVTDISVPDWEVVSSGELVKYILASMSIPMIFNPVVIDGRPLVDGGVMNNLPVEPLVDADCHIIGSDVQNIHPTTEIITNTLMAKRYYGAMMNAIQKPRVERCDLYISFPELVNFEIYDFSSYKKIVDIGYNRAMEAIMSYEDRLLLVKG